MTMLTAVGETYLCEECFAEFDSLVSLDQTGPGMVCPLCGSDLLRRQVSRFAPLPAYPVPRDRPLILLACTPGGG